MERCAFAEIRGTVFCLNLSIDAQFEFEDKFGESTNFIEILYEGTKKEIYDQAIYMFAKLATEGADYQRLFFGKDYPKYSEDNMRKYLKLTDINYIREKICEAVIAGCSRDVEIEVDDEKNVLTPGD